MTGLLYVLGWNVVIATVLAAAVWLACRTAMLGRRPALCHGLWMLVLVKLVTPPLIPLPVLPGEAAAVNVAVKVHLCRKLPGKANRDATSRRRLSKRRLDNRRCASGATATNGIRREPSAQASCDCLELPRSVAAISPGPLSGRDSA